MIEMWSPPLRRLILSLMCCPFNLIGRLPVLLQGINCQLRIFVVDLFRSQMRCLLNRGGPRLNLCKNVRVIISCIFPTMLLISLRSLINPLDLPVMIVITLSGQRYLHFVDKPSHL